MSGSQQRCDIRPVLGYTGHLCLFSQSSVPLLMATSRFCLSFLAVDIFVSSGFYLFGNSVNASTGIIPASQAPTSHLFLSLLFLCTSAFTPRHFEMRYSHVLKLPLTEVSFVILDCAPAFYSAKHQ